MLEFLGNLGGFPLLDGSNWSSEKLDKAEVFESVLYSMSDFFYIGFRLDANATGRYIVVSICSYTYSAFVIFNK